MTLPQGYEDLQKKNEQDEHRKRIQQLAEGDKEPKEDLLRNEYSFEQDFVRKKLPKIYNIETAPVRILQDNQIEISDIFYRAPDSDEIIGTEAIVVLHPHVDNSQLRPWKIDSAPGTKFKERIKYTVLSGRGSVSIQDLSKPIKKGDSFYIEAGVRHSIINNQDPMSRDPPATDLRVLIDYAGFFDFRDLYKIFTQGVKRSQESMKQIYQQKPQPPPQPPSNQTFI